MGRQSPQWSEAEEIFSEDVREKKRTAHSSARKRTHGGAVKFPADILTGANKRKYKKNGRVKIMYTVPETLAEFNEQTEEKQTKILKYLFDDVFPADTNAKKELCKKWGIAPGGLHIKAISRGVIQKPTQEQKANRDKTKKEQRQEIKTAAEAIIASDETAKRLIHIEQQQERIITLLEAVINGSALYAAPTRQTQDENEIGAKFAANIIRELQKPRI